GCSRPPGPDNARRCKPAEGRSPSRSQYLPYQGKVGAILRLSPCLFHSRDHRQGDELESREIKMVCRVVNQVVYRRAVQLRIFVVASEFWGQSASGEGEMMQEIQVLAIAQSVCRQDCTPPD